ncbi:MAG: hypothetical protein AB7I27_00130 [Bacteriovoracaceae bacterium]
MIDQKLLLLEIRDVYLASQKMAIIYFSIIILGSLFIFLKNFPPIFKIGWGIILVSIVLVYFYNAKNSYDQIISLVTNDYKSVSVKLNTMIHRAGKFNTIEQEVFIYFIRASELNEQSQPDLHLGVKSSNLESKDVLDCVLFYKDGGPRLIYCPSQKGYMLL